MSFNDFKPKTHLFIKHLNIYRNNILILIISLFIGQTWLNSFNSVSSGYDFYKFIVFLVFSIFAFHLGRATPQFKFSRLFFIFFIGVFLNFLFAIFRSNLPETLISFYYPERALDKYNAAGGFESIGDFLNYVRPRGLFGNPNGSMLLVNLPFLFIYLGIKKKFLEIRSSILIVLLVFSSCGLSLLLMSRNQLIFSLLISILILREHFLIDKKNILRFLVFFGISVFCLIIYIPSYYQYNEIINSAGLIITPLSNTSNPLIAFISPILSFAKLFQFDLSSTSNVLRPVSRIGEFWVRYSQSILLGTGISAANFFPVKYSSLIYHNDLLLIIASSGIAGFFSLTRIIIFFVKRLGLIILLPFIFPGLTNTFIQVFPAFLGYVMLSGIALAKIEYKFEV
tara:strand:- start:1125 stop:2315 length:1191 start_codon:yes stop_codon:yes gene_type:complete